MYEQYESAYTVKKLSSSKPSYLIFKFPYPEAATTTDLCICLDSIHIQTRTPYSIPCGQRKFFTWVTASVIPLGGFPMYRGPRLGALTGPPKPYPALQCPLELPFSLLQPH